MDTKQQEQVQPEREQLGTRKDQLLEIYKLHSQLANDISNRQNTISRFYATLISALIVICVTISQHKDGMFPWDPEGKIIHGYALLIIGFLGIILSLIWAFSINYHTLVNTRKYAILLTLESELEFQFFTQEKELGREKTDLGGGTLSKAETYVPYLFLPIFGILTLLGLWSTLERLIKQIFNA